MSMEYIRKTYNVPAKRGAKIMFQDHLKQWHDGTIVASRGQYLRVKIPTLTSRDIVTLHPTFNVEYITKGNEI